MPPPRFYFHLVADAKLSKPAKINCLVFTHSIIIHTLARWRMALIDCFLILKASLLGNFDNGIVTTSWSSWFVAAIALSLNVIAPYYHTTRSSLSSLFGHSLHHASTAAPTQNRRFAEPFVVRWYAAVLTNLLSVLPQTFISFSFQSLPINILDVSSQTFNSCGTIPHGLTLDVPWRLANNLTHVFHSVAQNSPPLLPCQDISSGFATIIEFPTPIPVVSFWPSISCPCPSATFPGKPLWACRRAIFWHQFLLPKINNGYRQIYII